MSWNKQLPKDQITTKVTEVGVNFTEEFGKYLATDDEGGKALTTSQLRKFFGAVKQIQMKSEFDLTDVVLLKPKLAYAVGRTKEKLKRGERSKIEDFNDIIVSGINMVSNKEQFKRFVNIFEAIVAYHKAAGGKEK